MPKTLFILVLFLIPALALAEPYRDRVQKRDYIESHGGHRYKTGVRTRTHQIEFGKGRDYREVFDRAKRNAGIRKPGVVIDATPLQMHRIRSEARRQDIDILKE